MISKETYDLKFLKRIFPNGKDGDCPECGQPMSLEDEVCESCKRNPVIDEVFILFNDGRLLDHSSRTLNPDLDKDKDIRSSMIVALQNYIDGSMAHEIGSLQELRFGGKSIMVTPGKYLIIAIVLERGEPANLRDKVTNALVEVEDRYDQKLGKWDGDRGKLEPMNKQLKGLLLA